VCLLMVAVFYQYQHFTSTHIHVHPLPFPFSTPTSATSLISLSSCCITSLFPFSLPFPFCLFGVRPTCNCRPTWVPDRRKAIQGAG
jgi:hypothetical protein